MTNATPLIACDMSAIPAAERGGHAALMASLFARGTHTRRDVPGGFAYDMPVSRLADLALFLGNERRCCPFLSFGVAVPAGADQLTLAITGPEGTRDFLELELSR